MKQRFKAQAGLTEKITGKGVNFQIPHRPEFFPVIPADLLFGTVEPRPELFAADRVIRRHRTEIGQNVGTGQDHPVGGSVFQRTDHRFLPFLPRLRFVFAHKSHIIRGRVSELPADIRQSHISVFHGIVKYRGDL